MTNNRLFVVATLINHPAGVGKLWEAALIEELLEELFVCHAEEGLAFFYNDWCGKNLKQMLKEIEAFA